MAGLTIEQTVFLREHIKAMVEAGDPESKTWLEIREQLDKDSHFENVKEDVLTVLDGINDGGVTEDENPLILSEEALTEVTYKAMRYDNSDYNEFISSLLYEQQKIE